MASSQTEAPLELHPSLLEVELEDHMEWAAACWRDPGADRLDEQLDELLCTAFLAEYSKPPTSVAADGEFDAAQLLVFEELGADSRRVLSKFGFEPVDFVADQYTERMSAWRREAEKLGRAAPDEPATVWKVDFARQAAPIDKKLERVQSQMIEALDGEVWGETPGGPSRLMATLLGQQFSTEITPDHKGVDALEVLLVQQTQGRPRAMRPLIFQGLCDFLGVVVQAEYGVGVQWALCEPQDNGFAPPPVFRLRREEGYQQVPVGTYVVDWCIMPRGEESSSLSERLQEDIEK